MSLVMNRVRKWKNKERPSGTFFPFFSGGSDGG